MKKLVIALILVVLLFSVTTVSATDVTDVSTMDQVTNLGVFTEENSLDHSSNYLSINNNQLTSNANSTIISSDLEMYYKDGSFFEATFLDKDGSPLKNATVQFNIVGKTYSKITDDNGIAGLKINLNPGNYKITAIHPDGTQQSNDILVKKPIISSDLEMVYKDGSAFEATFLKDGVPLKDTTIQFNIVGKTYSRVTDANGTARLNINLGPGKYVITSIHPDGFTQSNNIIVNNKIIKPSIISSDLEMVYKDGSAFEATFLDNGVPLKEGTTVQFNIVGKTYSKVTDANGTARLNINLGPGKYVITSIHPDGLKKTNTITVNEKVVKPSIISSDLEMVYKDGSAFEATFLEDGVPLKEGTTVQFNIIGKTYSKVTDANGTARLNINLGPGTYTITSIHPDGLKQSNTITVNEKVYNSSIISSDLEMYYNNGSVFEATFLEDGVPLSNVAVQFTVNSKTYNEVTDENGVAKLNVTLNPGSYVITSIHPYGLKQTNNLLVKTVLLIEDMSMGYKEPNAFQVTALDGQGNPLANATVQINIIGKTYNRITDENGVAKLNINLGPGTYDVYAIHPNGYKDTAKVNVLSNLKTYEVIENNRNFTESLVENLTFTLYNSLDHPLANREVLITINKNNYKLITDSNGQVNLPIDFNRGIYPGKIVFDKEGNYYQTSYKDFTVVVNEPNPVNITILTNEEMFKGEYYRALFTDADGNPLVNTTVNFNIIGKTYSKITDENGTAALQINLNSDVYPISCNVNKPGYSKEANYDKIYVYDNNNTSLNVVNALVTRYENLEVLLKSGSTPISNRNVTFTVLGKQYVKTTDRNGIAYLTIRLECGKYDVTVDFAGDDVFKPSSCAKQIEVCDPVATKIVTVGNHEFYVGDNNYYSVRLTDVNGNPVKNVNITFEVNEADVSNVLTDNDGVASLPISNYTLGTYTVAYTFKGTSGYATATGTGEFTIKSVTTPLNAGYYIQKQNLDYVDFNELAANGVNVIFLASTSIDQHGVDKVQKFINNAHANGIQVHVWTSVYNQGSFISPVNDDESINYDFIYDKADKILDWLPLGFDGVHLDHMRFAANAYKHPNGQNAITSCAQIITTVVKEYDSSLIVSMAFMPEMETTAKDYGQNITQLSKIVDVIVPMAYKGNYHSDSTWIGNVAKWYQTHSLGADVWVAILTYESDSNVKKLTPAQLLVDSQSGVDGGSSGVILFRFGLCDGFNFTKIKIDHIIPKHDIPMEFEDILHTACALKAYIEETGLLPEYVTVGDVNVTIPQFLYLMSKAIGEMGVSTDDIILRLVNDCQADSGDVIYGYLNKTEFTTVANNVATFIENNGAAPNYASTSLKSVKYSSLIYAFSRILDYYHEYDQIPAIVYVDNYLDNAIITVNMKPSSAWTDGYKYINYTTSWLNYCPDCHRYGSLLINPKGVPEGELTCAFCDADFCGVTGWDKAPAKNQLIRKSESIPTEVDPSGTSVTIAGILDAAVRTKGFIETNNNLPNYITIDNVQYSCANALYLFSKAIVNLDKGIYSNIDVILAKEAQNPTGTVKNSTLTKLQYLDVCNRVANYIANNKQAPNYASSAVGQVSYTELVDMTARILAFYNNNKQLPATADVYERTQPIGKTVQEVADELCRGLTSEQAKATALYNFVRDQISYEFYYNSHYYADGTLKRRAGNCCDQAQLLVAMFRAEGLTCRFVHGTCTFSSGSVYGHVWTQVYINGQWVVCDPTSTRNSYGVINNWNTRTATIHGYYDNLPF